MPFRFFCKDLWANGIVRDVTYRYFGLQKGFDSFSIIVFAWLIGYIEILLNKKNKNSLSINLDIFLILFTLINVLISARIAVIIFLIYLPSRLIILFFQKPNNLKLNLAYILSFLIISPTFILILFQSFILKQLPSLFRLGFYRILNTRDVAVDAYEAYRLTLDKLLEPANFLFGYHGAIYGQNESAFLYIDEVITSDSGIATALAIFGVPLFLFIFIYFLGPIVKKFKNNKTGFLFLILFIITNIKGKYIFSPPIAASWLITINTNFFKEDLSKPKIS